MILLRLAGMVEGLPGDVERRPLLDVAIEAVKGGVRWTGAEWAALSAAERRAMVDAWDVVHGRATHPSAALADLAAAAAKGLG